MDELKSLLLNLNLHIDSDLLDDYKESYFNDQGADSSRNGDSMNWEQFKQLYTLVLRNQSSLFREIFNNKKREDINFSKHLKETEDSLKECFALYDIDDSGFLEWNEFVTFLQELSLHKQYQKHLDPNRAFMDFCDHMWHHFDKNMDGRISFDEFVTAYNTILDH
jgi:Ca2+-binding EF-hand superfamily protein